MSVLLRRSASTVAVVVAGLALGACGSSASKAAAPTSTTAAAGDCTVGTGAAIKAAGKYTMVASLGPSEMMYTKEQVASQHPTDGEVMLSGTMSGHGSSDGMSTSTMGSSAMSTTTAMGSTGTSSTTAMGSSAMTTTTAMGASGATARHLEVHICTTDDGKVVTGADPTIEIASGGGMATKVDVATMQGIGQPASDVHYGNNVSVAPGTTYTVTVTLDGATATFDLTG